MSLGLTIPYPVLLGDIGGTNARFALLEHPQGVMIRLPRALTGDHAGPVDAIRAALLGRSGPEPRSACLAIATKVEGPVASLTNAAWVFDAQEIASRLGLDPVWLLNDYVPVAAALPALGDIVPLGPAEGVAAGPRVVLGPGTGLGAAALLPVGDRLLIHPTEAGHVDFGPAAEDEMRLWPLLERAAGRVTAESVLSGPGLLRLYQALAGLHGLPNRCQKPADVTTAGRGGSDALAVEALRLWARLLGRFAGDLALTFGATAVYVGGGIAPRILDTLSAGEFRSGFERKAPFVDWMRSVPTFVVTDPDPALKGLCVIASAPVRYEFPVVRWTQAGAGVSAA